MLVVEEVVVLILQDQALVAPVDMVVAEEVVMVHKH
jgi:hypothetical protein